MDRNRFPVKLLAAFAALVFTGAAAPTALLLREQAWTAPGETLAYDLTHAPGECLAATRAIETEIGRALFRSPALIGGPAARAGLSCNACHSNGRVNARFLLPELTDRAGHADVTSEWASHVRGDGISNPLPIPDLAAVSHAPGFGHQHEPSMEVFVRSVIEDEFQGPSPPAQAFDSVIAYLRALRSDPCVEGMTRLTLRDAAEDVRRAVAAAEMADAPTASLLLLAGQDAIGRIVERLPARRFARDRSTYEALARELGALRDADNMSAALETALPGWRARFDAAVARTARRERFSYFNEVTLRRALER